METDDIIAEPAALSDVAMKSALPIQSQLLPLLEDLDKDLLSIKSKLSYMLHFSDICLLAPGNLRSNPLWSRFNTNTNRSLLPHLMLSVNGHLVYTQNKGSGQPGIGMQDAASGIGGGEIDVHGDTTLIATAEQNDSRRAPSKRIAQRQTSDPSRPMAAPLNLPLRSIDGRGSTTRGVLHDAADPSSASAYQKSLLLIRDKLKLMECERVVLPKELVSRAYVFCLSVRVSCECGDLDDVTSEDSEDSTGSPEVITSQYKTYRGFVSAAINDTRELFTNCFFVGKSELAFPTGSLDNLSTCARIFLNANHSFAQAPCGDMTACPIDANTLTACKSAADWISTHSKQPCIVTTNAAAAPMLLSHVAVKLYITILCRTVHFTRPSREAFCIVFTYRCMRHSSHVNDESSPGMVISTRINGTVVPRKRRRPAPRRPTRCPFECRLRITISESRPHSSDSVTLMDYGAVLEFPQSPGYHGGTHSPVSVDPVRVDGVAVSRAPTIDGEADDTFKAPLSADVLRCIYGLYKGGFEAGEATNLAQDYATWLLPLFLQNPDIVTSAIPRRIILRSSGLPPLVCLRRTEDFFMEVSDSIDPVFKLKDTTVCNLPPNSLAQRTNSSDRSSQSDSVDMDSNSQHSRMHSSDDECSHSDDEDLERCSVSSSPRCCSPRIVEVDHPEGDRIDMLVCAAKVSSPSSGSSLSDHDVNLLHNHSALSKLKMPELLKLCGQPNAYSCFSWWINPRDVSSLFQTLKFREHAKQSAIDYFRGVVIPALQEHKWAIGSRVLRTTSAYNRELQVVVATPLKDLVLRRFPEFGGVISVDGLWGTTIFDQPMLPFVLEDYYTRRSLLLTIGTALPIELRQTQHAGAAVADVSVESGIAGLPIDREENARFCNEFAQNDVTIGCSAVEGEVALKELFSRVSTVLGYADLPRIYETKPHSRVSYIVLHQLRFASACGARPAYGILDDEPALWRAAHLHLHESNAEAYAILLRHFHQRIISFINQSSMESSTFDSEVVMANKFLMTSSHADLRPADSTGDSEAAGAAAATDTSALDALLTELFSQEFVAVISSHSLCSSTAGSRALLANWVILLLAYDLHRIRINVEHSGCTAPLGYLREFMDDVIRRWQAVALPSGPLGQYLRYTALLHYIMCHYHARAAWSRSLTPLLPDLPLVMGGGALRPTSAETTSLAATHDREEEWMQENALNVVALIHEDRSPPATAESIATPDIWATFSLYDAIQQMLDAGAKPVDIKFIVLQLVLLQAMHVRQAKSPSDCESRAGRFLDNLKTAWPAAHVYFARNYWNAAVRSLLCTAWRRFYLSSNATAGPESVNNLIRYQVFNGTRSHDPSAPILRSVGFPHNDTLTERSLANTLYNRNNLHIQQKGSTCAGLRLMKMIQKAAVILAEAILQIHRTSISAHPDRKPYLQVLCIHNDGTKAIYESRLPKPSAPLSGASVNVDVAPNIAAEELGEDVFKVPKEVCECPSQAVVQLLAAKASADADSLKRRVTRTEFVVDLSNRTCSCERNSTRCPELLAAEVYARRKLLWKPCVYDEDPRIIKLVERHADMVIECFKKYASCHISATLRSKLFFSSDRVCLGTSGVVPAEPVIGHSRFAAKAPLSTACVAGQLSRSVTVLQRVIQTGDATVLSPSDIYKLHTAAQLLTEVTKSAVPLLSSESGATLGHAQVIRASGAAVTSVQATAPTHRRVTAISRQKFVTRTMGKTVTTPVHSPDMLWGAIALGTKAKRRNNAMVSIGRKSTVSTASSVEVTLQTVSVAVEFSRVIAFDIETTGLSRRSRVVQFGTTDCDTEALSFQKLVNPGVPIPQAAIDVHGITNEAVSTSTNFAAVWGSFLDVFQIRDSNTPVVLLSYNGFAFDFPILFFEMLRAGIALPETVFYADMKTHVQKHCFGRIPKGKGNQTLAAVFNRVTNGQAFADAHSALGDAKAIKRLYHEATKDASFVLELRKAVAVPQRASARSTADTAETAMAPAISIVGTHVLPPMPTGVVAQSPSIMSLATLLGHFGMNELNIPSLRDSFLCDTVRALASPDSLSSGSHRGVAASTVSQVSRYLPNHSIASLRGWVDTEVLSFVFGLIEYSSSEQVTCLNAHHVTCMPGGPHFGDGTHCAALGESFRSDSRHLNRPVACSWTHDNHHGFLYMDHSSNEIYILDPLGAPKNYMRHASALRTWICNERAAAGLDAINYSIVCVDDAARQSDGMSCGVLVFAYVFFKVFYGRWLTSADIAPHYATVLRLILYKICMKGRLLRPSQSVTHFTLDDDGFIIVPDAILLRQIAAPIKQAQISVRPPRRMKTLDAAAVQAAVDTAIAALKSTSRA